MLRLVIASVGGFGAAKSRFNHAVAAIPKTNASLPGCGFGATSPLPIRCHWTFRGANRERCVSYFTLRWLSKKCKVAKKTMECSGAWSGAPTALRLRARHRRRRCVIDRPSTFRFKDPRQRAQGRRECLPATTCQRSARASYYGVRSQFWPRGRDTLSA